jgi:hypothetical protein
MGSVATVTLSPHYSMSHSFVHAFVCAGVPV